jgi:hypothetical protein
VFYAPQATNPSNGCQACETGASTTAWTNVVDGTSCGAGELCVMGTCGSQCDIGGAVYAAGKPNPTNACQTCQPAVSTSAFTSIANGTSCATGEVCNAGGCASGCFVGGNVYMPGVVNPNNPCQTCQPGVSTTAFTDVMNGVGSGSHGTQESSVI